MVATNDAVIEHAAAARDRLVRDGEVSRSLPLPLMVEVLIQQRDRARAALARARLDLTHEEALREDEHRAHPAALVTAAQDLVRV